MTLLVWKRKNKGIIIPRDQLRGIIALCLIIAVIPFFHLISLSYFNYKSPDYTEQFDDSLAVEISENGKGRGIYFIEPGTSATKLLQTAGLGEFNTPDLALKNGMKIVIDKKTSSGEVLISEMDAAQKLALDIPLDINKAGEEDLILVNGIGEATAARIIELREKMGQFTEIEQLTQIKGIKGKRLSNFRKYLYVEETSK